MVPSVPPCARRLPDADARGAGAGASASFPGPLQPNPSRGRIGRFAGRVARLALGLLLAACASGDRTAPGGPGAPAASVALRPTPVPPVADRPREADILHYDLDVEVDPTAGFVKGHAAIRFRALPGLPVDALVLDAVELAVEGAWDERGDELDFVAGRDLLVLPLRTPVAPGAESSVSIDWHAFPRRGLYFVAPSAADPTRAPHVWSQGECHEARFWFPCRDLPDERATTTLRITCDEAFVTLGPGERTSSRVKDGRRIDTWSLDVPHSSYLVSLVAGALAEGALPSARLELPVLAEADDLPLALQNFAATADMVAVFENFTGHPYPYPKYAQACVGDFTAGGMENASATTLLQETIHLPQDEPQAESTDLISHELAHMWFGDLLTCRTWTHLWLNESFATFCEGVWREQVEGPDRYRAMVRGWRRLAVGAEDDNSRPIRWDGWKDPDADLFDAHDYEAGALRLHMLRELLGREAFDRGVREYVRLHATDTVVTHDLRAALEQASGRDLGDFFQRWIQGPGYPRLSAELVREGGDGAPVTSLRLTQTRADGAPADFPLAFRVLWSRAGDEHGAAFELTRGGGNVTLDGTGDLDWACIDPDVTVPGTVSLAQPEAAWARQLAGASDAIARLDAAEWFARGGESGAGLDGALPASSAAFDALRRAARSDSLIDVRVAATRALGLLGTPAGTDAGTLRASATGVPETDGREGDSTARDPHGLLPLFVELLGDRDPRVREAAAAALANIGGDEALPALRAALEDPNASVLVAALRALSARKAQGVVTAALAAFEAGAHRTRLRAALVPLIASDEDDGRVLPFLAHVARGDETPGVRAAALNELPAWKDADGALFRLCCDGLWDASHQVRSAAAWALAAQGRPEAAAQLAARRAVEPDPGVAHALEAAQAAVSRRADD